MNFYEAVNREIDPNYRIIDGDDLKLRPIFIYGSGEQGLKAAQSLFLTDYRKNLHFIGFADSTKSGEITFTIINGEKVTKPIFTIDSIQDEYPDAVIILAMGGEATAQVKNKLKSYKFEAVLPSLGALLSLHLNPSLESFSPHYSKYEEVYNSFSDHISRGFIAKIAAARMGYCPPPTRVNCPQYFPDNLITLSENEVFVDCGAFDGYDSKKLIELTDNRFSKIYMFEPDKGNFNILNKSCENLKNDPRIVFENKGVWSKSDTLFFNSDLTSSSIILEPILSENKIEVISLDEYFCDKPASEQPTFIKMDIEGAEIEALKGAKNIIRDYTPKLAICVYHKIADIYEIPELIRSINPNYKMSLLHHSDSFFETVLYCY